LLGDVPVHQEASAMRWETINTAPRDGTTIMLWWGGDCAPLARWELRFEGDEVMPAESLHGWHLQGERHHIGNAGWLIYDDDPQPTHWCHVPGT
jgi:hypothetical protein